MRENGQNPTEAIDMDGICSNLFIVVIGYLIGHLIAIPYYTTFINGLTSFFEELLFNYLYL